MNPYHKFLGVYLWSPNFITGLHNLHYHFNNLVHGRLLQRECIQHLNLKQ